MTIHLFTTWSTKYCKLTVEALPLRKITTTTKIPFKILLLTDNASGNPRAVIEIYKIHVVFMTTNTISIIQPLD